MRWAHLAAAILAVALATWQRGRAVERLPPDFDELDYIPSGYRYAERMTPGGWGGIPEVTKNSEHPPLVKLSYGVAVKLAGAPEPAWEDLGVGRPLPEAAGPAFRAARWASAVPGIGQVAVAAAVHPLAGLLLALESYHAKYTAQAYLEGLPGLLFVLALLAFERATRAPGGAARRTDPDPRLAAAAFALLGAAAAGKYPFGAVGVLALFPLAIVAFPRRPLVWLGLAAASLAAFVALDPYLWPDPVGRLWESATYHFRYGESEHVKKAGLPWYQQVVWLWQAAPTRWHAGVFPFGKITVALLPLAALGFAEALRRRPVWAIQAAVSLAFLLWWKTKWPQYLVLLLVPLAVCAAFAPAAAASLVRRVRGRSLAAGVLALALAPAAAAAASKEQPPMWVVVRAGGRPVAVDEALRRATAGVPLAWHAALGLTREALEVVPAAPEGDAFRARAALETLLPEAQRCLPVLLGPEGKRRPAFGHASFVLTTDGRLRDVKVATEAYPGSAESAACVERVASGWRLPLPAVGGRAWTHLLGAGAEVAAPAGAFEPAGPPESWTKPWTVEPRCVADSIRLPPEGRVPFAFEVKFAVLANGAVSGFEAAPPEAPAAAVRAVERAVRGCTWVPAADPAGRPAAVWVVQSFRTAEEAP